MPHINIDFETMGKSLDGKVAYVAFTAFDIETQESIDELRDTIKVYKLNWKHPEQANWKIDKGVMEFWTKQPKSLQEEMLGNPETGLSVTEFAHVFVDFLRSSGFSGKRDIVWSRGTSFDLTILDRLLDVAGISDAYPFWRTRDTRTFLDSTNILMNNTKNDNHFIGNIKDLNLKYVAHDARDDVAKDIVQLQLTYKFLKDLANEKS